VTPRAACRILRGPVLAVTLLASASAVAAQPAYCTGQRITDDFGIVSYPNGQRVVDGSGKEYYPNGGRLVNDYGDEIRWSTGSRVRNSSGDTLFPNGAPVKSSSGEVRYPGGGRTRDSGGRCYFETGVEMTPCQRVVAIRDRLPGGETAFYQLDIVAGTLDLGTVRYEFPARGAVIALAADLAAGRLDRSSITAVCTSGGR
jgi:hypothetical protein